MTSFATEAMLSRRPDCQYPHKLMTATERGN